MLKSLKIIFTGLIGNIFEWYEFSLFAYFASDISQQFFPSHDKFSSLLQAFGVFAVGYLMRPLGAMWFGYFGDKLGRKKMLSTSIIAMAISTTLIGFIPGYQSIGVLSGILLLLCRIIQGFAVGGEGSGCIVYVIEQAKPHQKGLWGSFSLFGVYFGMLLGSLVSALITHFTHGTIYHEFAWRFCFIIGAILGVVGIYIRRYMPESPEFKNAEKHHEILANPLLTLFKLHYGKIFLGTGLTILPAVTSYMLFSYLPTHLSQFGHIRQDQALFINSVTLVIMLLSIPLYGALSDRFGRKPFLILSPLLIGSFAYLAFHYLLSTSLMIVFIAQTFLALSSACSESILPVALASIFPVNLRYSGIAVCWNIANGIFGGTVALVSLFLIEKSHNYSAPGFYLIAVAIIALVSALFFSRLLRGSRP
jgi:MHS family proline/betaine transporter-like MFS transporter